MNKAGPPKGGFLYAKVCRRSCQWQVLCMGKMEYRCHADANIENSSPRCQQQIPDSMHALICCHSGRTRFAQTLPSVAAAGLHLIHGIFAASGQLLFLFAQLKSVIDEYASAVQHIAFIFWQFFYYTKSSFTPSQLCSTCQQTAGKTSQQWFRAVK